MADRKAVRVVLDRVLGAATAPKYTEILVDAVAFLEPASRSPAIPESTETGCCHARRYQRLEALPASNQIARNSGWNALKPPPFHFVTYPHFRARPLRGQQLLVHLPLEASLYRSPDMVRPRLFVATCEVHHDIVHWSDAVFEVTQRSGQEEQVRTAIPIRPCSSATELVSCGQ